MKVSSRESTIAEFGQGSLLIGDPEYWAQKEGSAQWEAKNQTWGIARNFSEEKLHKPVIGQEES